MSSFIKVRHRKKSIKKKWNNHIIDVVNDIVCLKQITMHPC